MHIDGFVELRYPTESDESPQFILYCFNSVIKRDDFEHVFYMHDHSDMHIIMHEDMPYSCMGMILLSTKSIKPHHMGL
jgi:hypothetical protein